MNSSLFSLFLMVLVTLPLIQSYWDVHRAQRTEPKNPFHKKPLRYLYKKSYYIPSNDGIDWSDPEMMQHPMDDTPRKTHRGLGDICSYSNDCESGCCLLNRETGIRSCQSRAQRGERCTLAQIKGDLYVDACPCISGNDYCEYPSSICRK
ncbi:uncharacterized protein LOC107363736 [Tetranychus urticae]|nr:uncharacterized protein LOC107363736 [Tetranychus urticae]